MSRNSTGDGCKHSTTHYMGCDCHENNWAARLAVKDGEVLRLRNEIEALTHEGRQGELEQANTALAQEVADLRTQLDAAQAEVKVARERLGPAGWRLLKELTFLRGKMLELPDEIQKARDEAYRSAQDEAEAKYEDAIVQMRAELATQMPKK